MSCDITRVFASTVRALTTGPTPRKLPSTSDLTEKAQATTKLTSSDSFSSRARSLFTELVTVRKHLNHAGELSSALATNDVERQRMYHEVAKEINGALDQCEELLRQLQRGCRGLKQSEEKGQGNEHRKAVCRSLEEFLKTLRRMRDDQVSTYCRRVELAGRLGDAPTPPSTFQQEISSISDGVRKRVGVGNASSLFGNSFSTNTEALNTDSLPEAEFKQLEMENAEVYLRLISERNEVQRLGSQISEISRLQSMVTESLVEQAEMAQRIGEQVASSTELVREANDHLRQSMDKTRSVRFWIVFLVLTLTFSLHFLDCKVVVTGIQPTGIPHLGNYYGMIKPCVKIQSDRNTGVFFLLIADLHALTKHTPDNNLAKSTLQLATALIACGINPIVSPNEKDCRGKTVLFLQSNVAGHCELSWMLSSRCTVNRLAHLPQWREKSESAGESGASVGLFTYPILQSADVLLYSADVVPVGADQVTHLELVRDLARVFLTHWPSLNCCLKVPDLHLTEIPKIHNLREPTVKMSKSVGPETGTIWLTDSPDEIRLKVSRAKTDSSRELSYDPISRPGIANLMQIYAASNQIPVSEAVEHLVKLSKVELKNLVIDAIVKELTPIQARIKQLETSNSILYALSSGSALANQVASSNLRKIKNVIGLLSFE
nr:tryptophanyl tRNA synthetase [Hymenolepis microstoma]